MPLSHRGLARLVETLPAGGAAQSYTDRVLSYSPIAYWRLNETAGGTATDSSGNGHTGTYNGVTLSATTGPDGSTPAPSFDGINDFVNVYSAGFAGAFNGSEGSLASWMKVVDWENAGYLCRFYVDAANRIRIGQSATDNTIEFNYRAGDVAKFVTVGSQTQTGWFHVAMTWTATGDEMQMYIDGAQVGGTQSSLGTWAGALSSTQTVIGAASTTGSSAFPGNIADFAIFDTPLSADAIADLATV